MRLKPAFILTIFICCFCGCGFFVSESELIRDIKDSVQKELDSSEEYKGISVTQISLIRDSLSRYKGYLNYSYGKETEQGDVVVQLSAGSYMYQYDRPARLSAVIVAEKAAAQAIGLVQDAVFVGRKKSIAEMIKANFWIKQESVDWQAKCAAACDVSCRFKTHGLFDDQDDASVTMEFAVFNNSIELEQVLWQGRDGILRQYPEDPVAAFSKAVALAAVGFNVTGLPASVNDFLAILEKGNLLKVDKARADKLGDSIYSFSDESDIVNWQEFVNVLDKAFPQLKPELSRSVRFCSDEGVNVEMVCMVKAGDQAKDGYAIAVGNCDDIRKVIWQGKQISPQRFWKIWQKLKDSQSPKPQPPPVKQDTQENALQQELDREIQQCVSQCESYNKNKPLFWRKVDSGRCATDAGFRKKMKTGYNQF